MSILTINNNNFEKDVLGSEKPVLVDFYADWCGPCKMMSPIVEEIAEECNDTILVGKVNVDENQELAQKYGIMSIPTLILFNNGIPKETIVGLQSKEQIKQKLK